MRRERKRNTGVWIGIGLLAGVIAVSAAVAALGGLDAIRRDVGPRYDPVDIAIFYGGEKSRFLRNPEIAEIIERRYRITLDARKAGSVEMSTTLDTSGIDCVWPSNQVAVELARASGKPVLSDETIFNSPIVFFAWAEAVAALEKVDVVAADGPDGALTADVAKLAGLIESGARWREDLGLEIYGPMKVFSTDPRKSNSGNIWSALLATALNGGETPRSEHLAEVLPKVTDYFAAMGHMERSSGDIFENFLKQGMGARPIIVGYENQLVEFILENAAYAEVIRDKIRVIYPRPTIFASHPLIALSERCERLSEALRDPDVQDVAWRRHGFRTGLIGVQNDPGALEGVALPRTITSVAPMPSAEVMQAVIAAIK